MEILPVAAIKECLLVFKNKTIALFFSNPAVDNVLKRGKGRFAICRLNPKTGLILS